MFENVQSHYFYGVVISTVVDRKLIYLLADVLRLSWWVRFYICTIANVPNDMFFFYSNENRHKLREKGERDRSTDCSISVTAAFEEYLYYKLSHPAHFLKKNWEERVLKSNGLHLCTLEKVKKRRGSSLYVL